MKRCGKCRKQLPTKDFWKKGPKRLQPNCIACSKQYKKDWYQRPANRLKTIQSVARRKKKYRQDQHIQWIKHLLRLSAKRLNKQLSCQMQDVLAKKLQKKLLKTPKCPFLGINLIAGENLALDHQQPLSRRPELAFKLSNLQWVSTQYNRAKSNLTNAEFRKLCLKVLANRHSQGC